MCRSIVSVNAWEREYLQESQRCSVKGVQIKHLVSSSVLKGYNEKILTQLSAFHLPPPGFEIWGSTPTMKSNSLCSQSLSSLCSKGQHLLNSWAAPKPCSHQGQAAEQGPARQLLKVWQPQGPHSALTGTAALCLEGDGHWDSCKWTLQQCESEALGMQWLSRDLSLAQTTALPGAGHLCPAEPAQPHTLCTSNRFS